MINDLISKSARSFLPRVVSSKKSPEVRLSNNLVDDFFSEFENFLPASSNLIRNFEPRVNIFEDDQAYHIDADVAGVSKENVKLEYSNDSLIIKANKKEEKSQENKNYYRLEYSYGSMMRSFDLPPDVDREKIDAQIKDGILKIVLPKIAGSSSKNKEIKVN